MEKLLSRQKLIDRVVGSIVGKRSNGEVTAAYRIGIEAQVLALLGDGMSLLLVDIVADMNKLIGEIKVSKEKNDPNVWL